LIYHNSLAGPDAEEITVSWGEEIPQSEKAEIIHREMNRVGERTREIRERGK
jgi:hypothetical protein